MHFFIKEDRKFDLELVKAKPSRYSVSDIDSPPGGRFDIDVNGVDFECFLKKSDSEKLIVFFSAAGRTKQDTSFNRIAWAGQLNANLLYIEDPMYKKHSGLQCGWYYGEINRNYLDDVVKITRKISRGLDIKDSDIIFVGASSGGYAALFCANALSGSKAYAYNPQIELSKWPDSKNFLKITGIDLSEEDRFNRNDISYICSNNKSRFFIFYNAASKHDDPQSGKLLRQLNIPVKNGVHRKNGLIFMVESAQIHNPHMCVADINDFVMALFALYSGDDIDVDAYNAYINKFSHAVIKDEESYYSELWYGFINNIGMENFLHRPKVINKFHINFGLINYDGIFSYRISQQRISKSCEVVFYAMKNEVTFSDRFFKELNRIPQLAGYKINKYESDGFIRVSKSIPRIEVGDFQLQHLVNITKDVVVEIYERLKRDL